MTDAEKILANVPLNGKLTASIMERLALVQKETGLRPVAWMTQMQMEDDSVVQMRFEPCPDDCGQMNITTQALPG